MQLSQIERRHAFLGAALDYYLHHRRPQRPETLSGAWGSSSPAWCQPTAAR
jgi:hypothetical protein